MNSRSLLMKPRPLALLVLTCLLVTAVAGCIDEDEEPVDMEAFQTAMDAPGETYIPDEVSGGTDFRVKLIQPDDPHQMPPESRPFIVLVFDDSLVEPVVDADLTIIEDWMPDHGHQCGPMAKPRHDAGGVYEGRMHIIMPGRCEMTLDGVRPNGDGFRLELEFTVPQE